jgi:hypothetical protein
MAELRKVLKRMWDFKEEVLIFLDMRNKDRMFPSLKDGN